MWCLDGIVRRVCSADIFGRSDNSECFTRDDELLIRNEFDHKREVMAEGKVKTGLIGRITGNEMMNKVRYVLEVTGPNPRVQVCSRT